MIGSYTERERKRLKKAADRCRGCIYYEDVPGNILGVCHKPDRMICGNYEEGA